MRCGLPGLLTSIVKSPMPGCWLGALLCPTTEIVNSVDFRRAIELLPKEPGAKSAHGAPAASAEDDLTTTATILSIPAKPRHEPDRDGCRSASWAPSSTSASPGHHSAGAGHGLFASGSKWCRAPNRPEANKVLPLTRSTRSLVARCQGAKIQHLKRT